MPLKPPPRIDHSNDYEKYTFRLIIIHLWPLKFPRILHDCAIIMKNLFMCTLVYVVNAVKMEFIGRLWMLGYLVNGSFC